MLGLELDARDRHRFPMLGPNCVIAKNVKKLYLMLLCQVRDINSTNMVGTPLSQTDPTHYQRTYKGLPDKGCKIIGWVACKHITYINFNHWPFPPLLNFLTKKMYRALTLFGCPNLYLTSKMSGTYEIGKCDVQCFLPKSKIKRIEIQQN